MGETINRDIVHKIPKVALHEHLDGGLRIGTLIELVPQDFDLPSRDPEELMSRIHQGAKWGSLELCLENFRYFIAAMQTRENIKRVAREAVIDLAADNVRYVELRYAPEQHLEGGLTLMEVVESVFLGIEEGRWIVKESGKNIEVFQILCAMRNFQNSEEIAKLVSQTQHLKVVGFDVAGKELGYPPKNYDAAFKFLLERGLDFTIHAGEVHKLEHIVSAVNDYKTKRIGHGVDLRYDFQKDAEGNTVLGEFAKEVLAKNVHFEFCQTSNVGTRAVPDFESHPIRTMFDFGFSISINNDNRLTNNSSLTDEMMIAVKYHNFTLQELKKVTLDAARARFGLKNKEVCCSVTNRDLFVETLEKEFEDLGI